MALTPPVLVAQAASNFNEVGTGLAARNTTPGLSALAGDIILIWGITESAANATTELTKPPTLSVSTGSVSAVTTVADNLTGNECREYLYSATVTADCTGLVCNGNFGTNTSAQGGYVMKVWRCGGLGTVSSFLLTTGAPSGAYTTVGDNSAIDFCNGDWAAVDPAGGVTYRQVNSTSPIEDKRSFKSGSSTIYAAHYADAGTAGAKTIGQTAPSGQTSSMLAIEVKGTTPTGQTILPDADLATTGWTATPLFSKLNDGSDATIITGTLA